MTTILFTHPACVEHDPGSDHPESPERLRAVLTALDDPAFAALERRDAPRVEIAQLARAHDGGYVEQVLAAVPASGHVALDPDTVLSPGSGEAALRAAGAVCAAVDAVVGGEAANAFCAVRPPGHHAERDHAMGFCLFNNVAVGALHARAAHGLKRVAVVDFDVHHGNGTQHMFEHDEGLFYGSSHQWPAYPGTGAADETGEFNNICNFPMAPGEGSAAFRKGYREQILPALRAFDPDLLLISAGFDAHDRDPLAQISLETEDYAWVTGELLAVAGECCDGKVVSLLEGGYNLEALTESVQAHVRVLMAD